MSTAPKPKQRTSFTDKERQRLRCYHNSYPCLTPQQLASWFESEIGRRVATSSIYDMLSEKYAYLDNAEATDALRKKKGPQWAELEDALFLWRQAVQPHDVTGKELKTKANEIWQTLPACRGKKVPSFSDGWLSNWRVRHGLAQAARATDVEQPGFKVGRFEEVQCAPGTSASCAQRSVPHAQRFGLSVWNSDPPLMLPLEERLHHSRINFPHSAHQTMLDSESVRASPSKTQLCPAIASSHRHTASSRARETQVNEHRKIKRAKLTASRSLVAADLGNSVLRSNPSEAITRFDRIPWYGVQELFLKCKSRRGHDLILPGKIVLDALEPILSSLNFSSRRNLEPTHLLYELLPWRQRKAAAFNARKAAGLLVASEVFKLRQTKEDLERFMYEEWFLEFIDHNVLRSASPNPLAIEEQPSSSCSFSGDTTFRRQRNLRCRASVFSSRIKNGRVNIWTRSYTSDDNANDEHAVEQFQANIVITPPADVYPVPQTIVQLATRTSKFASILSTPIISFRTIIPEDSIIFDTAKHGTLSDLQMMLSSGEASLSDCDPSGRSLINYALQGHNSSTLKFLLTTVNDIDACEVNECGSLCTLVGLLASIDVRNNICTRDTRLMCLKLMLLAEADPSLQYNYGTFVDDSTIEDELCYGTVAAMKALLDLGQPYVSVNDTVGSALNEPPLLSLARRYRCLSNMSFDLDEKVFLLLERGADISARDRSGDTCLSVVLQLLRDMTKDKFSAYQEEEFKDILMCMITAGADVYASDQGGMTVSQTACIFGQEELWREVLAECGYDPDEVFSIENEFRPMGFQSCPGERVFSTVAPYVRPTKLSFKEYSEQRKLLDCVKKVYSREYVDSSVVGQECREFWESVIESSDSEDYEWASDMGEDEDDTDEVYSDDNEEYSSEDEEYDDDNMVEG